MQTINGTATTDSNNLNHDESVVVDENDVINIQATSMDLPCTTIVQENHVTSSIDNAMSGTVDFDRRSLRLYSKKHRVYIFREFLIQTYSGYLRSDDIILDVAGGKGDLSWIFTNIDHYQSIVLDPRRTINHIDKSVEYLRRFPEECIKRSIPGISTYQPLAALMPILEQKGYQIQSPSHIRIFVDDELVNAIKDVVCNVPNSYQNWILYWIRATQRTINFITPSGKNDFSLNRVDVSENNINDSQIALQFILRAKLIVGYHPDQATDACFQLAQVLHIPVCVVPCCVFPSEFLHRRLYNTNHSDNDVNGKPVEKYDDLIQFIQQQYPYIKMDTLDFPGTNTARRIVLFTRPEDVMDTTTVAKTSSDTTVL
jgi:hypothetical protein